MLCDLPFMNARKLISLLEQSKYQFCAVQRETSDYLLFHLLLTLEQSKYQPYPIY